MQNDGEQIDWAEVKSKISVGSTIEGTIIRKASFGIWVEIDGLWNSPPPYGLIEIMHLGDTKAIIEEKLHKLNVGDRITCQLSWIDEVSGIRLTMRTTPMFTQDLDD